MKNSRRVLFVFISLVAVVLTAQVQAKPNNKDKGAQKHFSKTEKIKKVKKQKYPNSKGKSNELPPGLAKRETLPPGLAKQLQVNGTLPPGLAKRDLPADLESRLPPILPGQKRMLVGDDMLLIEEKTNRILDIVRGIR